MTGIAPATIGAEAVAWNVYAGTITSSPQPMPAARNATSIVTVPFAIGTAYPPPCISANFCASAAVLGPGYGYPPHCPDLITSVTASISRWSHTGQAGYGSVRVFGPPNIASSDI